MKTILLIVTLTCSVAFGFEREMDEQNLHQVFWVTPSAIQYQFQKGSPKIFRTAVADCLQEWVDATGSAVKFVLAPDTADGNAPGITFVFAKTAITELSDAVDGGVTILKTDGKTGALTQVKVVLNGYYFKWHRGCPTFRVSPGRNKDFGAVNLNDWSYDYILLHEIGHALGIGHNGLFDSIMYGNFGHKFLCSDDILGVSIAAGKSN